MDNLQPQLVNMDTLTELMALDDDGSNEFVIDMLRSGFQQVDDNIDVLSSHAKNNNIDAYKKLGHYLKGALITLGLASMADTCEKMQRAPLDTEQQSLLDLIDELKIRYSLTKDYLIHGLNIKF